MKVDMTTMRRVAWAVVSSWLVAAVQADPYIDPKLLDVPWGNYSFIRQAWRGYLETVPAVDYLDGLGVVWNRTVPRESEQDVAAQLAWAGFRRVRIEIPWGSVRWDESGLIDADADRTVRVLEALKAHSLRPLILLNANHGRPCPVQIREIRVVHNTPAGSRSLETLADLTDVRPFAATITSFADGGGVGPLIESFESGRSQTLELSRPLPRDVKAGEKLILVVFRYPPLFPVGTPEFDRTAEGWLKYVDLVMKLVEKHYGPEFDVEIWNELTFGSAFLDVNFYLDPRIDFGPLPDFLTRGGRAWELANRTVQALKANHRDVEVIWGFSNTTFFHTAIPLLPPRLDGQSYHPYGTGRRCFANIVRNREQLMLDGYLPDGCATQPEGYAHSWQQTESLTRLIAPGARATRPPDSVSFRHYITEHGLRPSEVGVDDRARAQSAKAKFVLRAPILWLNKGITAIYLYNAYDGDDLGMGLLTADGAVGPALRALHDFTHRFDGAEPIRAPRQLGVSVRARDAARGVWASDPDGRHLRQEDVVAVLPFQVNDHKFLLGAYVMTQDFPADLEPQRYSITISGVRARDAQAALYSPESGTVVPLAVESRTDRDITLSIAITDVPRLIEIEEAPSSDARVFCNGDEPRGCAGMVAARAMREAFQ
jgi:hypothetical protein